MLVAIYLPSKILGRIIRYRHMIRTLSVLLLLICTANLQGLAQDTLPRFTATTKGNGKVLVSWTNNYPVVTQISIQRSFDSLKNFTTILTVTDPTVKQNGFVDTKALNPFMYYRIFIVLDSGKYTFSKSRKAFWDTAKIAVVKPIRQPEKENTPETGRVQNQFQENTTVKETPPVKEEVKTPVTEPKKPEPEKIFNVLKRDSLLAQLKEKDFKRYRDSVLYKTKDTLVFKTVDTMMIKPFVPKEVYKPSKFVYAEKDGNVAISLPDAAKKTYSVKFFEDDNTPLFEIKQVKDTQVIVDKVNFMHSGWFRFELYENGELKEKHKLFIPKD